MAYERVTGPLDPRHRGDMSAAIIAATVANSAGAKTRAKDFLPQWFKRKKTPEEMWQEIMRLNTQFGGEVMGRGDTGESDS